MQRERERENVDLERQRREKREATYVFRIEKGIKGKSKKILF
jgi:hypothetical protein